jgi:hypothetical protein
MYCIVIYKRLHATSPVIGAGRSHFSFKGLPAFVWVNFGCFLANVAAGFIGGMAGCRPVGTA